MSQAVWTALGVLVTVATLVGIAYGALHWAQSLRQKVKEAEGRAEKAEAMSEFLGAANTSLGDDNGKLYGRIEGLERANAALREEIALNFKRYDESYAELKDRYRALEREAAQ